MNRSFCFLVFQSHHQIDAALMAGIAGEFGTQPGIHDFQRQNFTGHTGTQGHHVGVVVQAGQFGGLDTLKNLIFSTHFYLGV